MTDKRTFIASSETFSDFQCEISLFQVETMDDIINMFRGTLSEIFTEYNLTKLQEVLNNTKFHIHGHTIESILTSDPEDVFFICDHT